MITVGTITFVACGKEKTDTEIQQVATKNAEEFKIVGYSKPGSVEIIPLVDKDAFLARLEQYLNSEEAGRYVSEDLRMWYEPNGEGKYAPLMSVSFFDLKEELSSTVFIEMEEMDEAGMIYYAVGNSSARAQCTGRCDAGCKPRYTNGIFDGCPCPDPKPFFSNPEDEAKWRVNHSCREKEPSLRDLFRVILDIFF